MEIKVESLGGAEYVFSFQQNLIMLHCHVISAQWNPDQVGVEVMLSKDCVKVGLSAILPREVDAIHFPNHHQSFYFKPKCYPDLLKFFKALGFPCPNSDPFGLSTAL